MIVAAARRGDGVHYPRTKYNYKHFMVDIRISITSKNNKQPAPGHPPHWINFSLHIQELIVVNHLSVTRKKKRRKKNQKKTSFTFIFTSASGCGYKTKKNFSASYSYIYMYMCREGWRKITYNIYFIFHICVFVCLCIYILYDPF